MGRCWSTSISLGLVIAVGLGACSSKGKAKVGGKRADAATMIQLLEAVEGAEAARRLELLAEGVHELCGDACKCLGGLGDTADREAQLLSCPMACDQAARLKAKEAPRSRRMSALLAACAPSRLGLTDATADQVGIDWLAAHVAGTYLAEQYAAASATDRAALDEAFEALRLPLAPGVGIADPSSAPAATHAAALPPTRTFVAIAAAGTLRAGPMPEAMLTGKGAVLATAGPDQRAPGPVADVRELRELLAHSATLGDGELELAMQEDPPPEEPEPEEEEEELLPGDIGTGTAMALEEGKMGKKDSTRAHGQYTMKSNDVDPALARAQALEAAKTAGILGEASPDSSGCDSGGFGFGRSGFGPGGGGTGWGDVTDAPGTKPPNPPPPTPRFCTVGLEGDAGAEQTLVIASQDAPALLLVEVIDALPDGGAIAVAHEDRIAAFPVVFGAHRDGLSQLAIAEGSGLVMVVAEDAITIGDGVGDAVRTPVKGSAFDAAPVKARLTELLRSAQAAGVRVKVRAATTARLLVAAIDTAVAAGADKIILEDWVDDPLRGDGSTPSKLLSVRIGQPSTVGDLDKATIRRYIKRNIAKITSCYEHELRASPALQGTVEAQFFISASGVVTKASAKGVNDAVARCIAGVIKAIEFPKPKGGGGVQVSYPFMFAPTGG